MTAPLSIWSAANARQASVNLTTYHSGVGVAAFWFMAGPGVDPRYDGTVAEARQWGRRQAARAEHQSVRRSIPEPGTARTQCPHTAHTNGGCVVAQAWLETAALESPRPLERLQLWGLQALAAEVIAHRPPVKYPVETCPDWP